jgi:hypothetical protein
MARRTDRGTLPTRPLHPQRWHTPDRLEPGRTPATTLDRSFRRTSSPSRWCLPERTVGTEGPVVQPRPLHLNELIRSRAHEGLFAPLWSRRSGQWSAQCEQRPVAYPSRRSPARPLRPEGTCGDAGETSRRVSVRFPTEPRLPRHGGIHHLFPVRNATGKPQLEPFPSGARRCHVLERTPGDGRVRVGTASQTLRTPRGDPRLPG